MTKKGPKIFLKIENFLDRIYIPVLGISLWKMLQVYSDGIFKNPLGRQAASISWSFFLSLFPMILFMMSVLPYMPHYDKLHFYIFEVLLPRILPEGIQTIVISYIDSNLLPNIKGLSNITILLSFVFATNGCYTLINGFNYNTELKRGFVREYTLSMGITLTFLTVIFLSIFGIYYSEVVLKLFKPSYDMSWLTMNLTAIISFISFPLFYFILLSLFYWIGCIKITKFREAYPGALLTTLLFVLLTYFFAIYVAKFARYNVLYGSIGTIILVMIWVNINVFLVLLGNELNLAIKKVKIEKLVREELNSEEF